MEEFTWPVQTKPTGTHMFSIRKTEFNDGYVQSAGNGINNHRQSWAITIDLPNPEMEQALDFLIRHAGYKRFIWKPPYRPAGTYVCETLAEQPHLDNQNVLTVTFEERF